MCACICVCVRVNVYTLVCMCVGAKEREIYRVHILTPYIPVPHMRHLTLKIRELRTLFESTVDGRAIL